MVALKPFLLTLLALTPLATAHTAASDQPLAAARDLASAYEHEIFARGLYHGYLSARGIPVPSELDRRGRTGLSAKITDAINKLKGKPPGSRPGSRPGSPNWRPGSGDRLPAMPDLRSHPYHKPLPPKPLPPLPPSHRKPVPPPKDAGYKKGPKRGRS